MSSTATTWCCLNPLTWRSARSSWNDTTHTNPSLCARTFSPTSQLSREISTFKTTTFHQPNYDTDAMKQMTIDTHNKYPMSRRSPPEIYVPPPVLFTTRPSSHLTPTHSSYTTSTTLSTPKPYTPIGSPCHSPRASGWTSSWTPYTPPAKLDPTADTHLTPPNMSYHYGQTPIKDGYFSPGQPLELNIVSSLGNNTILNAVLDVMHQK
jgi:hypothetical protein